MSYREIQIPVGQLLQDRRVFGIFDEEFRRGTWLDATALIGSECTLGDLYDDGTVPKDVLDAILNRLRTLR